MADTTAPAEQDFTIYQGQTWSAVFELFADANQAVPFDATGCEIDLHIREGVYNSGAVLKLSATTRETGDGAGRIVWIGRSSDGTVDEDARDPSSGVFRIAFAAADTAAVKPTKAVKKGDHETAEFIYDAEITYADGVTVLRIMTGAISMPLEVTHRE